MGRPKKKVEEGQPIVVTDGSEEGVVIVSHKDQLLVRQQELLGLLDVLKKNGFHSISNVEVALSQVNSELAKLGE